MFGRSRLCLMKTGSFMCNDFTISDTTAGGAEAIRLITGTGVSALISPMWEKALRKSCPLGLQLH